jgi:two-component system OmpR family sensor kinase
VTGSLRVRLLAITLTLLVVGIVVSDALVTGVLRQHLVDRVDRQVAAIGQLMSRIDPGLIRVADRVASDRLLGGLDLVSAMDAVYLDASGQVVGHTTTVGDRPSPAPPAAGSPLPTVPAGTVAEATGTDGSPWRRVVVPRPDGGAVAVSGSLTAVDGIVTRLRLVCLLTGTALVLILGVAGWLAIRAAFRPLRAIEEAAAAIAHGDLDRRIPSGAVPGSEVDRLTGVLNGMLDQIARGAAVRAESEARMRRFVADVSHELRTPLFGIAGSAELHLMGGGADLGRTMRRIDTEARRLTDLVETLLLLARLDEATAATGDRDGAALDMAPMDLRALAADAFDDLRALDPDRPVTLTGLSGSGPPEPAPVLGDEARLRQVVTNLVGNVHAHTPAGTPVRIRAGRDGDDSLLEFADSGPGVPPGQAALIFERFHRGDDARARTGPGGAGLGLSIVRSLVTAHGGQVDVLSPPGGGATFRIRLPAAADDGV